MQYYRGKARSQNSYKKVSVAETELWRSANREVAKWVEENTVKNSFAASLNNYLWSRGSLTPNQVAAVRNLIEEDAKYKEAADALAAAAPAVEPGQPLMVAFDNAKASGLRRIRMRLGEFVFKLAPEGGANPGAICVASRTGDTYLGKIMDGKLIGASSLSKEVEAEILRVIANPKEEATAYGFRTGECSICGIKLTNPESIERGIGPICAERVGF